MWGHGEDKYYSIGGPLVGRFVDSPHPNHASDHLNPSGGEYDLEIENITLGCSRVMLGLGLGLGFVDRFVSIVDCLSIDFVLLLFYVLFVIHIVVFSVFVIVLFINWLIDCLIDVPSICLPICYMCCCYRLV